MLLVIVAIIVVVAVVLLGVIVSRRNTSVTRAVRHVLGHVDGKRLPVLPKHYPNTGSKRPSPDLLIVLGDGWAGGLGVESTADDAWWSLLRAHNLPQLAVVRSVNVSAHATDVSVLVERLAVPSTLQGRTVAVVVQCGWNDIVEAQAAGALDALDIHRLADRLMASVRAFVRSPALQRAASVAVYVVDYPDASAGTGFTGLPCEPPLDRIYDHAVAVDSHLRALNMYSQALLGGAHNEGYAFVPLRATLAGVGSPESMHSVARFQQRPVGVDGRPLPDPVPAAFTARCGLMNANGQRYQSDLLAAHMLNTPYYISS